MTDHDESAYESRELINFKDSSRPPAITNLQSDDPMELWRMTAAATGPSCKEGLEILNQTFPLVYWFCHEATVNNPDRGPIKTVRTVLIDGSGNAYGFVSAGVYDSLRMLVGLVGPGPYDPPMMIQVSSRDKKGGRRFYAIEPAPSRADTTDKTKK